MPHDQNGKQLKNGDIVTLKAVISNLSSNEKDCNCTYNIIRPTNIDESYIPSFTANSKFCSKDEVIN